MLFVDNQSSSSLKHIKQETKADPQTTKGDWVSAVVVESTASRVESQNTYTACILDKRIALNVYIYTN